MSTAATAMTGARSSTASGCEWPVRRVASGGRGSGHGGAQDTPRSAVGTMNADAPPLPALRRVVPARALAAGRRRRVAHPGGGGQGRGRDRPAAAGLPERPPGRRGGLGRDRSCCRSIRPARSTRTASRSRNGWPTSRCRSSPGSGPAPARASGAGLLLMYASSLAGVSPGSQTGPLHPIDLSRPDDRPPGLHDTIAGWIEARDKDTDIDWIDRPLTAAEARHLDIAQVAATSIPDLLDRIDGRTVQTPGGPVVLHTRIATTEAEANEGTVDIRFENLGPINRVLHGVGLAVDGVFPARPGARGPRVRADAARVRLRRVRGPRHARPRVVRAHRRSGGLDRPRAAGRRHRAHGPGRPRPEAGRAHGRRAGGVRGRIGARLERHGGARCGSRRG